MRNIVQKIHLPEFILGSYFMFMRFEQSKSAVNPATGDARPPLRETKARHVRSYGVLASGAGTAPRRGERILLAEIVLRFNGGGEEKGRGRLRSFRASSRRTLS
jgi:hypothetical protein